jgi:lipopolysaccharide biosynthesis regulator YciM
VEKSIGDLRELYRDNIDNVEVYQTLGNLFRSRKKYARAIKVRQILSVRADLDQYTRGEVLKELGIDYKRSGDLLRSIAVLEDAQNMVRDNRSVLVELAEARAMLGEYVHAGDTYKSLGYRLDAAHCYVDAAKEKLEQERKSECRKLLHKAIKTYPASPEAWVLSLSLAYDDKDMHALATQLDRGLEQVGTDMDFTLLEGLLAHDAAKREQDKLHPTFAWRPDAETAKHLLPVLVKHEGEDVNLMWYAALMRSVLDTADGKRALERLLDFDPGFWPARMELIALEAAEQSFTAEFHEQLKWFLEATKGLKHFACKTCGHGEKELFFICPNCSARHSIALRAHFIK